MGDGWSWSDGLKIAAGIVFPPYGAYQVAEYVAEEVSDAYANWRFGEGAADFKNIVDDDEQLSNALEALKGDSDASLLDTAQAMHDVDERIFAKLNTLAATDGFSGFLESVTTNESMMAMFSGGEEMDTAEQVAMIDKLYDLRMSDPGFFARADQFMDNYGPLMNAQTMEIFGLGAADGQQTDHLAVLKAAVDDPLLSDQSQVAAISGLAQAFLDNPDLREDLQKIMSGSDASTGFDLGSMLEVVNQSEDRAFLQDLNELASNPDFAPAIAAIADNQGLLDMMRDDDGNIDNESMIEFIQGLEDRMEADPEYMSKFRTVIETAGPMVATGGLEGLNLPGIEGGEELSGLDLIDKVIESGLVEKLDSIPQLQVIAQEMQDHPGLAENLSTLMGGAGNGSFDLEQLEAFTSTDPNFMDNLQTVVTAEGFDGLVGSLAGNEGIMAMLTSVDDAMSPEEVTHLIGGLADRVKQDDQYMVKANDFITKHSNLVTQAALQAAGQEGDDMDVLAALDMGMDSYENFKTIGDTIRGLLPEDSPYGGMIQGFVDQIFELFAKFMPMLQRVMGAFDGLTDSITSQISGPEETVNEPPVEEPGPEQEVVVTNTSGLSPT